MRIAMIWKTYASNGTQFWYLLYASEPAFESCVPNLKTIRATTSPIMNTAMFAIDMVLPEIGWPIPGKPSTTASMITSTMTPATNRMNAGMTGVNAPHVLFEPLDVLVIFSSLLEQHTRYYPILPC